MTQGITKDVRTQIRFVNLTPHEVRLFQGDTEKVFAPSGIVARAKVTQELVANLGGVPVYRNVYGEVEGLPAPEADTYYIVSALAAQGARGRNDVVIPNDSVRDETGRIIGCRSLAVI